jgi:hypothetical protein
MTPAPQSPSSQAPLASSGTKDTIEAQSGRFEFFKQSLTLSSAGLAGIAALFTDQARVPIDLWSRIFVGSIGLALLFVVFFSLAGLSTYANLLTAVARTLPVLHLDLKDQSNTKSPSYYANGMVKHARGLFGSLFLASIFILLFAGLKLMSQSNSLEAALTAGRLAVARESRVEEPSVQVERFNTDQNKVFITYITGSQRFHVVISREGPKIIEFSREMTANSGVLSRP